MTDNWIWNVSFVFLNYNLEKRKQLTNCRSLPLPPKTKTKMILLQSSLYVLSKLTKIHSTRIPRDLSNMFTRYTRQKRLLGWLACVQTTCTETGGELKRYAQSGEACGQVAIRIYQTHYYKIIYEINKQSWMNWAKECTKTRRSY